MGGKLFMITFFICLAILIIGYFVYGRVVEGLFHPDDKPTPAVLHPDGVDYVPMKEWKAFLIQLLNIAGLGPIFGALAGALWGPVVFLWIVLGTVFGGAVHDYVSGMLSIRNDGASLAELVGKYLGTTIKHIMRVFSVILLVMVGTVFTVGPAGLLARLTPNMLNVTFWTVVVLIYYFLATLLPIDKIIGRIYPVFGICLVIMALGIGIMTVVRNGSHPMQELTFANLHPKGTPIWPMMFVTVACGAISGFHATQSPMIARTLTSERQGRRVFYGAMVSEGIIALIWAAAGIAFYGGVNGLAGAGANAANLVYEMSFSLLGPVGGVLAMIGVIACPITSGDTALRSARLTIADWFKLDQVSMKNRLVLTVPLLAIAYAISLVDYRVVWRYFAWSNQTLAVFTLWAGSVFMAKKFGKAISFILVIPAMFMSAVCSTYILFAPEGLHLSANVAYPIGLAFAIVCFIVFAVRILAKEHNLENPA
ncbi:carbon starvation protein CstA [Eubacterium brachy ATCC 33089]|jgi:carbon starvation protein A|nr:carbon starvation protein CstA [Eubacterium brachy ATCC 33089]